jgi:DNA-binding LacI/PurR family transcriptional regulator
LDEFFHFHPDDLSIMGFDHVVDTISPLTTIGVPRQKMGVWALKRLVETIEDQDAPPVLSCIFTDLIVRQATAAKR